MGLQKAEKTLKQETSSLIDAGTAKGGERVIRSVLPPAEGYGPRYLLQGRGNTQYILMNSNGYLGLSHDPRLLKEHELAARLFGSGAGAVRFISGTFSPHTELERALACFHGKQSAMLFSSAYATSIGVLVSLITPDTAVVSDELNHNCIINAMKLARPKAKFIYRHNDMADLKRRLAEAAGADGLKRVIVVTDGIFSMRGDHAPLKKLTNICRQFNPRFSEGIITVVDDSHGVGAFGVTGRGTEEYTGAKADILIGTLGKAFGCEGGYVASSETVIRYLREKSPTYIYSNPITPGGAAAACAAVDILDSTEGLRLLKHLRSMTKKFEHGLVGLGFETIPGEHPVVPLVARNTELTRRLVKHLFQNGILATGLAYPVVPKGEDEIRFQISAAHTKKDIDHALNVLAKFKK